VEDGITQVRSAVVVLDVGAAPGVDVGAAAVVERVAKDSLPAAIEIAQDMTVLSPVINCGAPLVIGLIAKIAVRSFVIIVDVNEAEVAGPAILPCKPTGIFYVSAGRADIGPIEGRCQIGRLHALADIDGGPAELGHPSALASVQSIVSIV